MAEVVIGGLASPEGFNAETGPDVTYEGVGTPVFDDTIEVAFEGHFITDNNGLNGAEVEYAGTGTPFFPGVAQIVPTASVDNSGTYLYPGGAPLNPDVSFFTTPILGPTYPINNDNEP